jgi:hypothetical protein
MPAGALARPTTESTEYSGDLILLLLLQLPLMLMMTISFYLSSVALACPLLCTSALATPTSPTEVLGRAREGGHKVFRGFLAAQKHITQLIS